MANEVENKEIVLADNEKNMSDNVLNRVKELQKENNLQCPANYSYQNALKSAWLILQETVDRDKKPVLSTCTQLSVANCLLNMVVQGLSPAKKQCYFIAYGKQLQLMRSYMGTVAVTKRLNAVSDVKEPLGFLINHKDIGTLLFATDTSYLEYRFKNLSNILIECNYSEKILLKNMDNGSIDSSTGVRIASTHMSFENCKELVNANNNPKLKNIVLLHLSDENSNAKEFKQAMEELTHKRVEIADKGLEIELSK